MTLIKKIGFDFEERMTAKCCCFTLECFIVIGLDFLQL